MRTQRIYARMSQLFFFALILLKKIIKNILTICYRYSITIIRKRTKATAKIQ